MPSVGSWDRASSNVAPPLLRPYFHLVHQLQHHALFVRNTPATQQTSDNWQLLL
jgi:hypothetical protein